jgi:ABC-type arginine transport system permease subunit
MDYKSLTLLSLRLTGVIILVVAVTALPNTFLSLHVWSNRAGSALLLITMVSGLPTLVGLLLIYFPGTIANRMVSAGAETIGTLPLPAGRVFGSWPLLPDVRHR